MNLREALCAFLDHRREVLLVRRTGLPAGELSPGASKSLQGYIIAYLNIDEVIRIIRFEDHPEAGTDRPASSLAMSRSKRSSTCACVPCTSWKKSSIRKELDAGLEAEQTDLDPIARRRRIGSGNASPMKSTGCARQFGPETVLGRRRTELGDAPGAEIIDFDALVEKEPLTVLCSEKGWIRTVGGHITDTSGAQATRKATASAFILHAMTTDKPCAVRHGWPLLHHTGRPAAARPRLWRADPPVHRSRQRQRYRLLDGARPGRANCWSPAATVAVSSCRSGMS